MRTVASRCAAPKQFSRWIRVFPIMFFSVYLTGTVLFFVAGPFEYPVDNPWTLYLFLALAHLALLAGYWRAASGQPRNYFGPWKAPQLLLWSATISLLLLLPTSRARTGNVIPDIVDGIVNTGDAYARTVSLSEQPTGMPIIEYARIISGPLIGLLLPLTVFYWRQLTRTTRVLAVAGILGTVALFVAMGTNKAIADTVLLVPWMTFAGYKAGKLRLKPGRIVALGLCSVSAFVLFFTFFGLAMEGRSGSPAVTGYFPATGAKADADNFLVSGLSAGPAAVIMGLDIYLTPGYYALSLSLREPFVPMYGVGNSMFLYRQAARLTGDENIMKQPYPVRIEKYGWDAYGLWSSIYPWIASDVSFPGTILVVYLIGRLFALSWLDTLGGANPFAVVMFSQFLIMLFYFPANNQLLQSGEGFTAFWVTLFLWLRTRRRQDSTRSRALPKPSRSSLGDGCDGSSKSIE
jgi:hypothetical protein